jgi:CheY-like chemotaxis protein
VDDEPDFAESTAEMLALHGFRATPARGGAEALAQAAAEPPDVALIDLAMPVMDGCEVARRMREVVAPRKPVLVAVTGMVSDGDRLRADAAGFHHYLVKPVPPAELLAALGECQAALAKAV